MSLKKVSEMTGISSLGNDDLFMITVDNGDGTFSSSKMTKDVLQSIIDTGEDNTASNIGVDGTGLFDSKNGVTLQFKNVKGSTMLSVTDNATNHTVDLDLVNSTVTNTKLAPMAAWSLKMRNLTSSGVAHDAVLADLTEETDPVAGDFALGFLSSGEIRIFDTSKFLGGGEYDKYSVTFVDGDLTSGVLTVTHNLADQFPVLVLTNGSNKLTQPDDVTYTDANTLAIDLSSYGSLTGTWTATLRR